MTGHPASIYVKPVKGARVRRAEEPHAVIPEEGANVPNSAFYKRRITDNSLEIARPPRPAATVKPAPEKSGKKE